LRPSSRTPARALCHGLTAAALLLSALLSAAPAAAFEHHHALGTGYQFAHVSTDGGEGFGFHSLPVTYIGRYGPRLAGLFRFSALVPLLAVQGDVAVFPGDYYDTYGGFDVFVGPAYRVLMLPRWDMDLAVGGHFNYLRLTSDEFVEWSSATAGFGIATAGRHHFGKRLWGGRPELGVHGDLAFDMADFSREGDLSFGVQILIGVSLGLEWDKKARSEAPPAAKGQAK
jgi:hypothetical protein